MIFFDSACMCGSLQKCEVIICSELFSFHLLAVSVVSSSHAWLCSATMYGFRNQAGNELQALLKT